MNEADLLKDIQTRLRNIEKHLLDNKQPDMSIELNQNFIFTLIIMSILYYMFYS